MTETNNTDETNNRSLEERVAQLEEQADQLTVEDGDGNSVSLSGLLGLGLTRRQAIAAVGLVAYGAAIPTAIMKSIGTANAQTSSNAVYGIEQLGLQDDPIGTIYVDQLFQNQDNISTNTLTVNTRQVYIQPTEPSSPTQGDVWIDTSEVE
ncbi:hypothetical protein [Natrinema sp. DC36]|uniref:hypothetical protein n=1 Tax=Natrinema sp. DC36 TaxID=2878680 RepID=UPI001CF00A48|nr:hypothetical protein [Natrinema sp. DC36]